MVLGDVLDDQGKALAAEIGSAARYVHHDVSREEDWERAVHAAESEFGRLDVLVNNAGIIDSGPLRETSLDAYMRVIQVNQVGTFLGMRAVIDPMQRAGGGAIVNISSVAGLIGVPGLVGYTASKFAIRGMTRVAAIELGPLGIRVNSVHPGGVDTDMVRGAPDATPDVEGRWQAQPIARVADPMELARLVLFLASDESSFCTGSEFVADGGALAGIAPQRG